MSPRHEIEKILRTELDCARDRYERARAHLTMGEQIAAHEKLMTALQGFSDFTLRGIIPDHLKEPPRNQRATPVAHAAD